MRIIRRARYIWRHKNTVVYTKTNALQLTTYEAYEDLTGWKNLFYVVITQANDDLGARDIYANVYLGGVTYTTGTFSCGVLAYHHVYRDFNQGALGHSTDGYLAGRYTTISESEIKIEIVLDDPAGTNQLLRVYTVVEEMEMV